MQKTWHDLRYAVRGLLRAPAFAFVAICSMAVGIGTNTAVFGAFNSVLLRPFPYPSPDQLVAVYETNPKRGVLRFTVCPPDFLEWRELVRSFASSAAYRAWEPNLTGIDQPERLTGLRVTGDFFALLRTQPLAGRVLLPDEESSTNRAVVISHALWTRVFGGDAQLVGRTLRLDGESYVVSGIMPAGFQFPNRGVDIWAPLDLVGERNDRGEHSLQVVARLSDDGTMDQARSELTALMSRHAAQNDGDSADLASLRDWYVGSSSRRILWVLLGAVSLLLLIACANVANLLLARNGGRTREIMIRTAIGATRGRLLAQLVTESLVLAILAGLVGLLLAMWSAELLVSLLPPGSAFLSSRVAVDGRVLAYTFAVSIAAGLLFGVVPALRYSHADFSPSQASTRSTPFRLRSTLLVAQTALAVTLIAGAGLLTRTFVAVWSIDPGFSSADVMTARITLPTTQPDAQRVAFFDSVLRQIAAHPGVSAAGAVTHLPLSGSGNSGFITIEGREVLSEDPGTRPGAARLIVTAGYFRALEIPIREGRAFTDADVQGRAPVVVVNEAMARRYWAGESPIGRRIKRGTPAAPFQWMTIVGVVGDVQQQALGARPAPMVYLPLPQSAEPAMSIVVKSALPASAFAAQIRAAVRAVDRDQPIAWIRPLDDVVFGSLGARWLPMLWMIVFAGLAVGLAALGVYGVVTYAVEQRRREFGIRLALGADRSTLIRLAVRQGITPALVGTIVGLGAAALLARANATLLAGVAPLDAPTFLAAACLLALFALGASYPAARRIANADASLMLRSE